MQTSFPIYYLMPLAREDCWSLLSKHAFGGYNCSNRSKLEVIGKKIVKKCDGLLLATVALGGVLRAELLENWWNKILKSNIVIELSSYTFSFKAMFRLLFYFSEELRLRKKDGSSAMDCRRLCT
jgi:hypothetical protein